MLELVIKGSELFNEETGEFYNLPDKVIRLEHSLISLSKWESKYQKPFLGKTQKTREEILDYLKFMVLPDSDPEEVLNLQQSAIEDIQKYIDSPQSATTFGFMPQSKGPEKTITSELIYYWLVAFNIPWEAQTWHLNRLFSLIRISNLKSQKPQKMSPTEIAMRNRELNEKRKLELGTKG